MLPLRDIYLLLIRLLLGYVFASSGLCKLTDGQFGQLIGPPLLIKDLAQHGLAGLGYFLASSQVLIGALVLSGRWSLLGLVSMVPLNAGILAFTLAAHWKGTPFVNGFLLLLNLLALAAEWPTLRFFLLPESTAPAAPAQLIQLWPGWRLPTLTLLLTGSALLAALLHAPLPLTAVLGALGFGVAWLHAARGRGMDWPEWAVLGVTGGAVLALSLSPLLDRRLVVAMMQVGALGGVLGAVGLAARQAWHTYFRTASESTPPADSF